MSTAAFTVSPVGHSIATIGGGCSAPTIADAYPVAARRDASAAEGPRAYVLRHPASQVGGDDRWQVVEALPDGTRLSRTVPFARRADAERWARHFADDRGWRVVAEPPAEPAGDELGEGTIEDELE